MAPVGYSPVDPRTVGIDPQALKGYEKAMEALVKKGVIPGCASVVFRKGQIVHAGEWGKADVQTGKPFRYDTLCRLVCATKSYVTLAFATLVDEGVLDFDDRLDKYLPAFKHAKVQAADGDTPVGPKSPILLKHLPSHQSGIGYSIDIGEAPEGRLQKQKAALVEGVMGGKTKTLKAFVDQLAKCPLHFHPGENYTYGYSVDVLGRVLEVVCKTSLDKVLTERVFKPLGMHSTLWAVPDSQLHRLAALYGKSSTWEAMYGDAGVTKVATGQDMVRLDGLTAKESGWTAKRATPVLSGGGFITYDAGGLVSTVADTVRFVQMLLNKGVTANGERLVHEKTLAAMEKNRAKKSWGQGMSCYLGNVGVFREGGNEFGMGGAACTYWSVDREDEVATVWFTQHVDMPEFEELVGVDAKKADLWGLMHEAVKKGVRKRPASATVSAASKRRRK